MDTSTSWTYDELLCFSLIYVAHYDLDFTQEERLTLSNRFDADLFQEMFAIFNTMTEFQAMQHILDRKSALLKSVTEVDVFIYELYKILMVDGFVPIEKSEINFFKLMMRDGLSNTR